jgi:hypothetical protein
MGQQPSILWWALTGYSANEESMVQNVSRSLTDMREQLEERISVETSSGKLD